MVTFIIANTHSSLPIIIHPNNSHLELKTYILAFSLHSKNFNSSCAPWISLCCFWFSDLQNLLPTKFSINFLVYYSQVKPLINTTICLSWLSKCKTGMVRLEEVHVKWSRFEKYVVIKRYVSWSMHVTASTDWNRDLTIITLWFWLSSLDWLVDQQICTSTHALMGLLPYKIIHGIWN